MGGAGSTHLHEEIGAFDVQSENVVEELFGGGLERAHRQHAGAGDQDVDFPELVDRLLDHLFDLGDLADVRFDREGSVYTDGVDQGVRRFGVGGVVDDDAGAVLGEAEGGGFADAFGGTGDEGDFSG